MNAEEYVPIMQLLTVCILQAKAMASDIAGVGINLTATV